MQLFYCARKSNIVLLICYQFLYESSYPLWPPKVVVPLRFKQMGRASDLRECVLIDPNRRRNQPDPVNRGCGVGGGNHGLTAGGSSTAPMPLSLAEKTLMLN